MCFVVIMQDNSKWRQHYLNSLYEYMQSCNREVGYLSDEQAKILQQDWSDRMVDPPDVRRRYEVRALRPCPFTDRAFTKSNLCSFEASSIGR